MTTSELIHSATEKAAQKLNVSVVSFTSNYAVEIDTEYMYLTICYTNDDAGYSNLTITTNSRMDKQRYGAGLLLERLDAKLLTM